MADMFIYVLCGIGNCIENAQITISRPSQSFNFLQSEPHFSKIVMHILFTLEGVFSKDLEPMLLITGCVMNS